MTEASENPSRGPNRGSFRFKLLIFFIESITWILAWLPARIGLALGAFGGWLFFHMSVNRRRIAVANIEMIKDNGFLPQAIKTRSTACHSFCNLGRSAWEALCFYHRGLEPFLEFIQVEDGGDHLKEALMASNEKRCGLILATGHCGNWELLGHFVSRYLGRPMTIIGRNSGHTVADELIQRLRTRGGNRYASKRDGAMAMLSALRKRELVGTLIDQAVITGHVAAMIPFMGRKATTNLGPIRIAQRTKSILLMVLFRREGRHHFITIKPPISSQGEHHQYSSSIENDAHILNQWLGNHIKQHPDQWMWGHRRWKTKAGVHRDSDSII